MQNGTGSHVPARSVDRSGLATPASAWRCISSGNRIVARDADLPQAIMSFFETLPGRFLPFLPFRNETSISVPLTRTSSQRR